MKKKLVLTLSGGMDSSVLLYMAQDRGFEEIHTITFDYGQRHKRELNCVMKQIVNFNEMFNSWFNIKVTNKILDVKYIKDIAPTSSLTNENIDNPDISEIAGDAQPVSYVPFRNLMFLSMASSARLRNDSDVVFNGSSTPINHCSVARKITGVLERQSWG